MKSILGFITALAVSGVLVAASAAAADKEAGFKPLFNGKNLNGWRGNPELWSVQDGAITGVTKPAPENPARSPLKHNTFLVYTAAEFGDFELRFKYRIVAGNSGVQYRSQVLEEGAFGPIVGGYQADFEAGTTYSGILYEERGRGILAKRGEKTVVKPHAQPADPKGKGKPKDFRVEVVGTVGDSDAIQAKIKAEDWNDYVIIAKGNHLQHFINGMKTIEVTDEQESKAAKSGVIAIQIHQGPPMTVQLKDVRIKVLKSERSDLDLMQGNWAPVAIIGNGQAADPNSVAQMQLTITGNSYEVRTADSGDSGSFEINPTQNPKWMEVTTRNGTRLPAIYEVSQDTLRVCYAFNDRPRPTEFDSQPGSDRILATYQRAQQ
jgi:uncharacterized protein (TIGR03067 family)